MPVLMRLFLSYAIALFLVACAGTEETADPDVDRTITPAQAVADEATRGRVVKWGGVILSSTNLKDSSQLEVLGYPLGRGDTPQRDQAPLGRFLVISSGYLETVDYAPGRLVTVVGPVTGSRASTVGEASYTYPVITADRLNLVNERDRRSDPRFHFGIGVGIGL